MPYEKLHPIKLLDFQINRVLTYGPEASDAGEVRTLAGQIRDLDDWFAGWKELGSRAEREQRTLHAAFYYRMAEFFLVDTHPEKRMMAEKSAAFFRQVIELDPSASFREVPYAGKTLKALVLTAAREKGKLVVFGGYDSFIEEFYPAIRELPAHGYSVYCFEGPGQGRALRDGLTFEPFWEKPVSAVLDHFGIREAGVIGISWGGYLALRAAAFDKRIRCAAAFDILYDGYDCMKRPFPLSLRLLSHVLLGLGMRTAFNGLLSVLMRSHLLVRWAVGHGMTITGARNPFEFYGHLKKHSMRGIENRVDCHVLLLAGERDHYIPLRHYHVLMKKLRNARSLEGRIFTSAEGGQEHCQTGNHQLAILAILDWLDRKMPVGCST